MGVHTTLASVIFLAAFAPHFTPIHSQAKPDPEAPAGAAEKDLTVKVPLPVFRTHVQPELDEFTYCAFVHTYHRAVYRDFDHFYRIQPEMMISAPYLQYSLWWKGLGKLPCLKEEPAPVQWLRKNLKAEHVDEATLSLRWIGKPIPEAPQILKAVAAAYSEEGADRRYSKRAWRMAHLQKIINTVKAAIAEREKRLATVDYADNPEGKAFAEKFIEVNGLAKRKMQNHLKAIAHGEDPPPLYFETTSHGPVLVPAPKDGMSSGKVWLADYGHVRPKPIEDDVPGTLTPSIELSQGKSKLPPLRK